LLPAGTDQRDLVPLPGHQLKIESNSIAVDFAAQSAVQQCNPHHNEPAAPAPQTLCTQLNVFDIVVRRDIPIRNLRDLKFCVHTRPVPAKFKPAPHPQEFEKFCPHPPRTRPADHPTRARPTLYWSQTRTCPKTTKNI